MSDVSKTNAGLLEEAKRLIADCSTYNFGLRNADRLAHEVAPQLVAALEAATRVPVPGEPNDVPELVDVVLTTADIEQLAHLLVQLSPATQKNSGATVRRLMQEMNIKEVEQ